MQRPSPPRRRQETPKDGSRLGMDYGYFGPVATGPLVSTIASVVGVLMMFGQQIGQGAEASRAWRSTTSGNPWPGSSSPGWLALRCWCSPWSFPGSPLVQALRGTARLDSEIEMARADGYYEQLIRSPGERRKPRPVRAAAGLEDLHRVGPGGRGARLPPENAPPEPRRPVERHELPDQRLGFRGPAISRRKPPGTFRVVVLGSSNTMGHGVEDEQTYAQAPRRLARRAGGAGRRVEVVNLAVSGDSPTQQLLRLQLDAPELEPDWILSDITALDFSLEEQHLRWVVGKGVEVPFDFVREALDRSGVDADDSADEFHQKFRPVPQADAGPDLRRPGPPEARRIGVPLTVVILPRADSKTESPGLFRLFRDLADRHGLGYVDLSDAFDRLDLDDYRIGPWDHHPNALGHRLIFARLRDGLLGDGAVPSRGSGSPGPDWHRCKSARSDRDLDHQSLTLNEIVNEPVRLLPLSCAVIEPLRPACSPATDVALPCRVAVKLPLAFVWPVPV